MKNIKNTKTAILVTDGFEESEFTAPKETIEKAGGTTVVVSLNTGTIKSWKDGNWGDNFQVDKIVDEVEVSDFDALVLPGGLINPDTLRKNNTAVNFVKEFVAQQKTVAAICHGAWLLAEAGVLEGRKITSYSSIKTDMINAGAQWVDEEVVIDNNLITSRNPKDLPVFCNKIIEKLSNK